MPRFMTRKVILALGLALVLAAGGIATASNMGFKFVKSYSGGNVTNTVSLPYFQSQFTKLSDVFNDIPNATSVCTIEANETRLCWLGNFTGSPVVPVNTQNGLVVSVSGGTQNEVLVGSHNPSLALSLTATVTNFKSLPYHMTYTKLNQIFNDIPTATSVCTVEPNETRQCWLGNFTGSPVVSTQIGAAYVITTSSNQSWTPDHY